MQVCTAFKIIQNKACLLEPSVLLVTLKKRELCQAFRKHGNGWLIKGRCTERRGICWSLGTLGCFYFCSLCNNRWASERKKPEREEQCVVLKTMVRIWRKKSHPMLSSPGYSLGFGITWVLQKNLGWALSICLSPQGKEKLLCGLWVSKSFPPNKNHVAIICSGSAVPKPTRMHRTHCPGSDSRA